MHLFKNTFHIYQRSIANWTDGTDKRAWKSRTLAHCFQLTHSIFTPFTHLTNAAKGHKKLTNNICMHIHGLTV